MADEEDIRETTGGAEGVADGATEGELRDMVQTLLNKVDDLQRQIADGQAAGDPDGFEDVPDFEDVPEGGATGATEPVTGGDGFDDWEVPDDFGDMPTTESASRMPDAAATPPTAPFPSPASAGVEQAFDSPTGEGQAPQAQGAYPDGRQDAYRGDARYGFQGADGEARHEGRVDYVTYQDGYRERVPYDDMGQPPAPDVPLPDDVLAIGPSREVEEERRRARESWLGRYGTGIAASVLVVLGAFLAVQVSGSALPPLARVAILFLVGAVMEVAGIILVRGTEDGRSNGFFTSVTATGTVATFLALCVGGMLYGMYGPPVLGLMLLAWFAAQLVLSGVAGTKAMYVIAYVGGASALVLEGSQVSESLNPMTASVFAILSLLVPAVSLPRRAMNPIIPYASAGFSAVTSVVGSWLLLSTVQERGLAAMTMEQCVASDPSFAILLASSFASACAALLGASLARRGEMPLQILAKVSAACVGLVLIARSLLVVPWALPVIPHLLIVAVALAIVVATRNEEAEVPLAVVSAWSLSFLWAEPSVPSVIPSLAVACVLPLLPWSRSSRMSTASALAFVATSWVMMWGADYAATVLPWVAAVSLLGAGSCVSAFRLSTDAIRLDEESEEDEVRMDERPRLHDVPLIQLRLTPRRRSLLRRLVPLAFATMASMALMPLSGSRLSPVPPDVVPATLAVLLALHMAAEMRKTREREAAEGVSEWGYPPRFPDSLDRQVRIWRTVLMAGACVMAVALRMGVTFGDLCSAEGVGFAVAACSLYSVTLFVAPTCLVIRSVESGSRWAVGATIVLAHLSFLAVAWVWVQGLSLLVASCISVAMSVALVAFGFRQRRGDIRMAGLVSMLAFVVKIAVLDIPKATSSSINAIALVVAGILCFAISFAYNMACRAYDEVGDDGHPGADGEGMPTGIPGAPGGGMPYGDAPDGMPYGVADGTPYGATSYGMPDGAGVSPYGGADGMPDATGATPYGASPDPTDGMVGMAGNGTPS